MMFVFAAGPADATEGHGIPEAEEELHEARHGGSFGDADDQFHYEALINPQGELVLYVNDERNQPLDVRTLQGRFTINPDSSSLPEKFIPSSSGEYFHAVFSRPLAETVHVKVEVFKGAQWVAMEFFLPNRLTGSPEAHLERKIAG
ncbi:MAG: hypothetical protein HY594_00855 [Candidatus Omnitrophica bacterium]|nr:hypothetical protein [Candidatus Omnitrophota bacterium]